MENKTTLSRKVTLKYLRSNDRKQQGLVVHTHIYAGQNMNDFLKLIHLDSINLDSINLDLIPPLDLSVFPKRLHDIVKQSCQLIN